MISHVVFRKLRPTTHGQIYPSELFIHTLNFVILSLVASEVRPNGITGVTMRVFPRCPPYIITHLALVLPSHTNSLNHAYPTSRTRQNSPLPGLSSRRNCLIPFVHFQFFPSIFIRARLFFSPGRCACTKTTGERRQTKFYRSYCSYCFCSSRTHS